MQLANTAHTADDPTVSRILLNIGNTNTEWAIADGIAIRSTGKLPTDTILKDGEIHLESLTTCSELPCLAACVVPEAEERIIQKFPDNNVTFLDYRLVPHIDFSLIEEPETIGADRLANAVAGLHLFTAPVIVVDCGTAITGEVIDREKRFRGGMILPGRRIQRRALGSSAGLLPEIPMSSCRPNALGTTTRDSIRSGIDLALIGALKEILSGIHRELGVPECRAVAVGGDAGYFIENIAELTPGPRHFTLMGLAVVAAGLTEAADSTA